MIGITNRPDLIDTSMLRPGRLDLILYIGPPDDKGRLEIMNILTSPMPLANDVNLKKFLYYLQKDSAVQTLLHYAERKPLTQCEENQISSVTLTLVKRCIW